MSNPFSAGTAIPGHGTIHVALLPPKTPRLRTASYQYPLKLVSPAPVKTEASPHDLVHTVYLLTYGGGLVAGDSIDLDVTLDDTTKLVLLTQGSTKLFKAPSRSVLSSQRMNVHLAKGSALCYLPDPVQPFAMSSFEQQQIYTVPDAGGSSPNASLCVLDWVSNGRPANGENWSIYRYASKNEIFTSSHDGQPRLLLRDSMFLDDHGTGLGVAERMNKLAVYGTLILHGSLFDSLGQFFMAEFKALSRIGGRQWDSGSDGIKGDSDPAVVRRLTRQRWETIGGLLWSAATLRNCTVIKFGARNVQSGRDWLRTMLLEEGTIFREFGERSLMCLR